MWLLQPTCSTQATTSRVSALPMPQHALTIVMSTCHSPTHPVLWAHLYFHHCKACLQTAQLLRAQQMAGERFSDSVRAVSERCSVSAQTC